MLRKLCLSLLALLPLRGHSTSYLSLSNPL
nr:MAG TPA: hypothetical protein [Caudoviricetes sp.]